MLRVAAVVILISVGACSKKDEAPAPQQAEPTSPAAKEPAPAEPAPPPPPALPAQADIEHGKVYWAVYFVNAPPDTEPYMKAGERLEALGFAEGTVGAKDAGCDVPVEGQEPAPKTAVGSMLLAAYYEVEADARAVAARYGDPAPWVGQVKTMCLD